MFLSVRTYTFYIVIAMLVFLTACSDEGNSPEGTGENTPTTVLKPTPTVPDEETGPPLKNYVPDTARLDSLLFERFKEKGQQFVAAFKAPAIDENFFNRFFDDGNPDAKLPISDQDRRFLRSVLFPYLAQLKAALKKERSGIFGGSIKASNNVLSPDELLSLGKLSLNEKKIIDTVLLGIKDSLVINDRLISDFEPYIFSGLKTDEKLSKLYEGKDPLEVSIIHRALYYSAALSVIQDINMHYTSQALTQYTPYFDANSCLLLMQERIKQVQEYLSSKIATL